MTGAIPSVAACAAATTTTRVGASGRRAPSSSSSSRCIFKNVVGWQRATTKNKGFSGMCAGGVLGGSSLVAVRSAARRAPSDSQTFRVVAEASRDGSSGAGVIDAGSMESTKSKINKFITDNSLGINAAINIAIVGFVAFGAFFEIIGVDSDISAGWTWYEILRNVPQDNLQAYQRAVFDHPLPVKAMTSGVAYTLGDVTCQLSQGKTITTLDLKRSLRSGVAGFMIHGPLCHYWLQWTEDNLSFDGAWFAIPAKVVADQTAWSLLLNSAYTTCIMSLQGMGPMKIKGEVEATWFNALSAGWKFWPFVHMLTFSPLIPQDFKLLFVDCVEVIWVTILSAAVNRDKEKALQVPFNAETEMPAVQLQEQLENEFSISVNGVEADFSDVKDFLPSVGERVGASEAGSSESSKVTNMSERGLGGRGDEALPEEVEQRTR